MPHTSSAEKRLRQAEKRRLHNKAQLRALNKQVKSFLTVVKEGTVDEAKAEFSKTAQRLDKAGAKRIIHKNKAAHKKSQLAKMVHARVKPAAK